MILGAEDPLAFIGQPLGWATVVAVLGLALSGALRFKREVDREVEARQSAERERDQANTNATKWQEAHAAEVEARKFAERAVGRLTEGETLALKLVDALERASRGSQE